MEEIVKLEHISKTYSNGIIANNDVTISFYAGEICALAGENGAGKSTIMKILYGAERPDAGSIYLRGQKVRINSPKDAVSHGIGMVYQHFMLVNEFKVYENIFFGIEKRNKLGILKKKEMISDTKALGEKYGMNLDPNALTSALSVGQAQKTEILKVLQRGAKIIILDEPTAVLTPQETKELFDQIRLLKKEGCTIIIITHKLQEIKELCDRVVVMKAGCSLGSFDVKNVSEEEISALMVGGKIAPSPEKEAHKNSGTSVVAKNLTIMKNSTKCAVDSVSFSAFKGEILCFAGVEGNGQEEVIKTLAGINKDYQGSLEILGHDIKKLRIRGVRQLGVCYIPEDRMKTGADLKASVYDNLIALSHKENSVCGFIRNKRLKLKAQEEIEEYRIKGSAKESVSMLSGGNMQKVVIARELESKPSVILADQPTRGVDIGASAFIHQKLIEMRNAGFSVIVVSADLNEVFALADRILVFHNGEITAEITDVKGTSEEELGQYMLGLKRKERKDGKIQ